MSYIMMFIGVFNKQYKTYFIRTQWKYVQMGEAMISTQLTWHPPPNQIVISLSCVCTILFNKTLRTNSFIETQSFLTE